MFVQMFRGPVRSGPEAMELLGRWLDELRPDAPGWLGLTAGVTPDGELVSLVRFASEDDAKRNSDRPEQAAWWGELEKHFSGPVTFHDCSEVATFGDGGDDRAGFVQVIEASGGDAPAPVELVERLTPVIREHRPDVIGGYVARAEGGAVVQAVYFTSEADARRGEAAPLPDDVATEADEFMRRLGQLEFHDLPDPLLAS